MFLILTLKEPLSCSTGVRASKETDSGLLPGAGVHEGGGDVDEVFHPQEINPNLYKSY